MTEISYSKKEEMYLDWVNNFLTVDVFAQYYSLSTEEAEQLINEQRSKLNK